MIQDPNFTKEAEKYSDPIVSREYIINYLTDHGRPATWRQLCKFFQLAKDNHREALRRRLLAMVRDGQLYANRRGAYGLLEKMELITGYIVGHKDGFGFVVPESGGEDLFISPRQMRTVFPHDRVVARIANIDYKGRREGLIIEVLERNTSKVVGRLVVAAGSTYVQAVDKCIVHDIIIPSDECGNACEGQMVVATIVEQPTMRSRPIGKITEIIGDHMARGMEIEVSIRNHNLPYIWPQEVLEVIASLPEEVVIKDSDDRIDLRHLPFVTIDGEDACDFDDAVYCQPLADGNFRLYVGIADVSHYVKPNSPLDQEAYNRGNSVYFPGRVIPMLPEILANNLCSLKPKVPRLVMVCDMIISCAGEITNYNFYHAVIQSQERLTYTQVYEMYNLDGNDLNNYPVDVLPELCNLFMLYHVLDRARKERGAIDFELPETQIIFDENSKIKQVLPLIRNDAHRLIEECMLAANCCAAKFLLEHNLSALYRNHEGPNQDKITDLRRVFAELGIKLSAKAQPVPADFAKILHTVKDRPEEQLIQTMLLRSLGQAVYSPYNKGHFGLALPVYTHFTSPIRRYSDLLVHRAISSVININNSSFEAQGQVFYQKLGEHCSMTERRADNATREAVDWLRCEFMQHKLGEILPGVISGVTGFGVFVMLDETCIEGLVHISNLPNDYYQFDAKKMVLKGERTKKLYRLGDKINIKVAKVNLDEREIDFVVAQGEHKSLISPKKNQKRSKASLNKKT